MKGRREAALRLTALRKGKRVALPARAAAPATCGEDADVPVNPPLPLPPEPRHPPAPSTGDDVASGPAMSGLIRPSTVGPSELYDSKASVEKQIAPTAITFGELAGSVTLPAATSYASGPTPEVLVNKSKRGVVVAEYRQIATPKLCVGPEFK